MEGWKEVGREWAWGGGRGRRREEGPQHFESRILESRVARMSHAKRARSPQVRGMSEPGVPRTSHAKWARAFREPHLGTQSFRGHSWRLVSHGCITMQFCQRPGSPVARNGSLMAGWPDRCSRCFGLFLRPFPPLFLPPSLLLPFLPPGGFDTIWAWFVSVHSVLQTSVLDTLTSDGWIATRWFPLQKRNWQP